MREKLLRRQAPFDAGCQSIPLKMALVLEIPGSPIILSKKPNKHGHFLDVRAPFRRAR
jgi:hypothetical protein